MDRRTEHWSAMVSKMLECANIVNYQFHEEVDRCDPTKQIPMSWLDWSSVYYLAENTVKTNSDNISQSAKVQVLNQTRVISLI